MRVSAPREDSALGSLWGLYMPCVCGETGDAEHHPRETRFWGPGWRRGDLGVEPQVSVDCVEETTDASTLFCVTCTRSSERCETGCRPPRRWYISTPTSRPHSFAIGVQKF
jgi:hypothetical protein